MASAVAWRIFMANIRKVFMMEIACPLAVRREVAFCEAVHEGRKAVEGVEGVLARDPAEIQSAWKDGKIAVVVDPTWQNLKNIPPDAAIDAILAKKNCGTNTCGRFAGDRIGSRIHSRTGRAHGHRNHQRTPSRQNYHRGIKQKPILEFPVPSADYAEERVLRSPADGIFQPRRSIGDLVKSGEVIGTVGGSEVTAGIDGVLRGLIRSGSQVHRTIKIGDIDPRGEVAYCSTISDKARAIGGSVLEAIMRVYNH
jgi:xanthine dehydrogenase accessory factor